MIIFLFVFFLIFFLSKIKVNISELFHCLLNLFSRFNEIRLIEEILFDYFGQHHRVHDKYREIRPLGSRKIDIYKHAMYIFFFSKYSQNKNKHQNASDVRLKFSQSLGVWALAVASV